MAFEMPQVRPKTAPRGSWKAIFLLLNILSNFDSSWVAFLIDFGPPNPPQVRRMIRHWGVWKLIFFWHLVFVRFWPPPSRPKRCPWGPKRLPRCHLGVIFGSFGGQVGPSALQKAKDDCAYQFWHSSWAKFAPKSQRRLCKSMLQISQRSTKTKHFNPQEQ